MKLWMGLLLVGALLVNADDAEQPLTDATPIEEDTGDLYVSPQLASTDAVYLHEHFDDADAVNRRWIRSASKKAVDASSDNADAAAEIAQYDGVWSVEAPLRPLFRNDLGLVLKSKAKHAAIAVPLSRPFVFADKPLIVQYEVQLQEGQTCGGSYVKLLTESAGGSLSTFNDQTPYTIMFGPDKCGNEVKLHFIFRHVNPLTGQVEEKHCRKAKERIEEPFKDKQPHLYTLIVRPDNTYTIQVDRRTVNEGSLLVDFTPAVNPDREIDDASDSKPTDWDEREKIADPSAERPSDWDEDAPAQIVDATAIKPAGWLDDEEELVADPAAVKPADWDAEMDGEWEPPLIENEVCTKAVGCGLWQAPQVPNPAYRGRWHAPLIDNPNYRGKWAPRRIANPEWFEDLQPFRMKSINAVGFELWSMSGDILFDNILITESEEVADQWAAQTYDLKREKIETEAKSLWQRAMRYMNHKPGWWMLYFLYCAIPIAGYVTYLLRRSKEKDAKDGDDNDDENDEDTAVKKESFVNRIIKYANENPYMYAMFIVFVGLPLTFIMYFFCKSAPEQPYESNLSRHKKTDLNEDDEDAAGGDAADEEDTAVNRTSDSDKSTLRNRSKSAPAAEEESVEDDAQPSESDSAASNDVDDDEEEDAEDEEAIPQLIDATKVKKSAPTPSPPKPKVESVADNTRKRLRPRKE